MDVLKREAVHKEYADSRKLPECVLKMATVANHVTGDLSRDEPCYAVVSSEDDDNFYGSWLTGYGFFGLQFPKATTRDLTTEEQKRYDEKIQPRLRVGSLSDAMEQEDPIQ